MKETRLIIQLLKDLDTNSPKIREEAIQEYFKSTSLPFEPDQVSDILSNYINKRIAKTEIGKISYNLKKDQIKTNNYKGPGFNKKGLNCKCFTCDKKINSDSPRFFEKLNDKWIAYCGIDEICIPQDKKEICSKNPMYIRYKLIMSQIKDIKKDLNVN